MNTQDPNHPLWSLLRVVVRSTLLALLLVVTSNKFDKEWIVLIAYALMDGGIESRGPWKKITRTNGD